MVNNGDIVKELRKTRESVLILAVGRSLRNSENEVSRATALQPKESMSREKIKPLLRCLV